MKILRRSSGERSERWEDVESTRSHLLQDSELRVATKEEQSNEGEEVIYLKVWVPRFE